MVRLGPEEIAADRAAIVECVRVTRAWTENLRRWSAALDEVERLTRLLDLEQHTQQANEDMGREIVRQRSEIERLTGPFRCCTCCPDDDPQWHAENPKNTHETSCPTCDRADGWVPLPDRDALIDVMIGEGCAAGSSLHSWRCEYPDRYGPCDCVAELADAVLAHLKGESPA